MDKRIENINKDFENPNKGENFEELFEESMASSNVAEGKVVEGIVVGIENYYAIIDIGYKAEGKVALKEFTIQGKGPVPEVGDKVEVFLEKVENRMGEAVLSRERAKREEAWTQLEKTHGENQKVEGVIFGRVKGGFTVDLGGAIAFLPGSQVDVRPVRDPGSLIGSNQTFHILKMDRKRGNIVVSRRSILEESRAEARAELVSNIEEGQVLEGTIKNITDYGAFVDLGDVDGLLHVTDLSWKRITNPNELLAIGQQVKVKVIRFNTETQRISLGMKQLEEDPWKDVDNAYPIGQKFSGRITNVTDYGAFVELGEGVEGLVHVSEMSWTQKNGQPSKIVSTSQEVEVVVLEIDKEKRRLSLGMKQTSPNPWALLSEQHPVGSEIEGAIRSVTEFGIFIRLPGDIDGLVHLSDIDWIESGEDLISNYKEGDNIKTKIIEIDLEKERVSLGIKQLTSNPLKDESGGFKYKKGDVVTCVVEEVTSSVVKVSIDEKAKGVIKKLELAKDRSEQKTDRFAVGEKIDVMVLNVDNRSHMLSLSIKSLEVKEEKAALENYGSTDSGASLGDILGAALEAKSNVSEKEKKSNSKKNSVKAGKEKKSEKTDNADDLNSKKKTVDKKDKSSKASAKLTEQEDIEESKDSKAEKDTKVKKDAKTNKKTSSTEENSYKPVKKAESQSKKEETAKKEKDKSKKADKTK